MSAKRYAYNFPGQQFYRDRRDWRLEARAALGALSALLHPRRERELRADRAAGLRYIADHPEMIQNAGDGEA